MLVSKIDYLKATGTLEKNNFNSILKNKNMYTIQYPNIKKFILLSVSVSSLFLASCGGGDDSNNLEALKQKQAELKTELANLATQISKLEGDSANKFVLVDAAQLHRSFSKHTLMYRKSGC